MFVKTKSNSLSLHKRRDYLSAWLFLIPGIITTIWLRYYPIVKSFYMSLFVYDAISPPGEFIGFENYTNLFKTGFYWEAWQNTFVFLILTLLLDRKSVV